MSKKKGLITILSLTTIIVFSGCSYKTTFYKNNNEVGRIESGSKGTYTFKDKDVEMTAEFGKPLIEIGTLAPKVEN